MLNNKILTLFLMRGMSLKKWQEAGIYDREIDTYKLLAKQFKKIYIVSYGGEEEKKFEKIIPKNIEILINKRNINSFIYSFISSFIHYSKIKSTDYIKTEQMDGAWSGIIAKFISKGKFVLRTGYTWSKFHAQKKGKTVLDFFVQAGIEFIERTCYLFSDKAVVGSLADKNYLIKKYKFIENKIHLIPNYINTDIFKNNNEKKDKDIIFVGRLSPQKNIPYLFESLSGLTYQLTIIGQGEMGGYLKKLASDLKLNVNFIEKIDNYSLTEILNRHKIFVLPSFYEGMPKVLLEAMSCGLVCIGTNVDGIREIIRDKENGLLSSLHSEDLKEKISLLMDNSFLREKIGLAARKTIEDAYSLSKNIKKEISVYEYFGK